MKSVTSLRIDTDLLYKAKVMNLNISEIARNSLKAVISHNVNDTEKFELEKELKEIQDKIIKLKSLQTDILTKLAAMKYQDEKEHKELIKERVKEARFIKRTGIMEDF